MALRQAQAAKRLQAAERPRVEPDRPLDHKSSPDPFQAKQDSLSVSPAGPSVFLCSSCGRAVPRQMSVVEARTEFERNFPGLRYDEQPLTCDDCFDTLFGMSEALEN